jgi:hypothetical protein
MMLACQHNGDGDAGSAAVLPAAVGALADDNAKVIYHLVVEAGHAVLLQVCES